MIFIQSLKATARQIIELSNQLEERVHTWNQQKSAPAGGYTDRAGFIVYDDIELYADVYVSEDGAKSLLRARLALSPKADDDQNLFTIITLDFKADPEKTKAVIADSDNLSQQTLLTLLEDPSTIPGLIHVSLEAGKDTEGKQIGIRYEHAADEIQNLSEAEQVDFITTLNKAYDQITSKP
jgi:hypothetical protein